MISFPIFNSKKTIFVFSTEGDKISILNSNIVIKDKDLKVKVQCSCYNIFCIYIIGDTTLTTPLIKATKKFGFHIVLMTITFKIYSIISFGIEGNTQLKNKQYLYDKIDIGKMLIINKIENQISILKSFRKKSDEMKKDIKNMDKILMKLSELYIKNNEIELSKINIIMGYEGSVSKIYFKYLFEDLDFSKRMPRIKADYINSILDIGYTVLFNFIDSIVSIYGFDTYFGFLHRQFYMRKSLICDLIEPFRPLIDLQIKKSIHLKQFSKKDFKKIDNKYILKFECNKKYIKVFYKLLDQEKEYIFYFIQSFYRAFMREKSIEEYTKYIIRK